MLYLTCTTITSVDLTHYGVSRAKDWVSVDCGTNEFTSVVHICIHWSLVKLLQKKLTRGRKFMLENLGQLEETATFIKWTCYLSLYQQF